MGMTRVTRRRSRHEEEENDTGRRDMRKQRTRRALLDAALELMQGDQSFNSISLRKSPEMPAWCPPPSTVTSAIWMNSA
jgi:hypothetical protein